MKTVVLAENVLDSTSWTTHEVESICAFLSQHFGPKFPPTGRIYHEYVSRDHDVTPKTDADIERLESLEGKFHVVVYPAAAEVGVRLGLLVFSVLLAAATQKGPGKPQPLALRSPIGSPNNLLGARANQTRIRERIPDIFGMVRSTPDLVMRPYILYLGHREVETSLMCVGRGIITCSDIREGDTLASEIEDMSVGVYEPGNIPTGVEGTSTRQTQIGEFISDPVYNVAQLEGANGQIVHPDNHFIILGDRPLPSPGTAGGGLWGKIWFHRESSSRGRIYFPDGQAGSEISEKIAIDDVIFLNYPAVATSSPTASRRSKSLRLTDTQVGIVYQDGTGSIPNLIGLYDVVDIDLGLLLGGSSVSPYIEIDTTAADTEWQLIATYANGLTGDTIFPSDPAQDDDTVNNGRAIITVPEKEWVGPLFFDDEVLPPNTREIVCNYTAQQGLFAEDGKTSKQFNVEIEIEVTPADDLGVPLGTPLGAYPLPTDQSETILAADDDEQAQRTLLGAVNTRSTRALSVRFEPTTTGKFVIRSRRVTRTPWREDAPSQFVIGVTPNTGDTPGQVKTAALIVGSVGYSVIPASVIFNDDDGDGTGVRFPNNGGGNSSLSNNLNSTYLVLKGTVQDEVKWTHCYSLKTVEKPSFGDVTLVHARTVGSEGALEVQERSLNLLAQRRVQTWNGSTFGGTAVVDRKGENSLFTMLKDPEIGNLSDDKIDFAGIAAAFADVRAHFGGPDSDGIGGDVAAEFSHTFDDQEMSLEEMVSILCTACFCIPYREGDIIKVKTDLSDAGSVVLVNHRNRLPDSDTRTLKFGTEADYDGVFLDYVNVDILRPNDDAVRTYSIPPNESAVNPLVLELRGIRTKRHAAWHAWRTYNRLLHQRETAAFQLTEEAAILTLNDRIQVADSTRPETQDGEVTAVDGLNLTLSQPVDISSGDHTVFLQHVDGTVEAIAVASSANSHEITLAGAPALSLVTDNFKTALTRFEIVPNTNTRSRSFVVAEKNRSDNGVYDITATNYSEAFFFNDGLLVWIPVILQTGLTDLQDWGPYELDTTATGGTTVTDVTRGRVYDGAASTDHVNITTAGIFASANCSAACWVNKDPGVACAIYGNPENATNETLLISASEEVRWFIDGTARVTSASFPTAAWHHVAVTLDDDTGDATLYVNGEVVDTAASVPSRSLLNLRIFGNVSGSNGFQGRCDDFRYYMRVLAPGEIRELYQKTRIV